MTAQPLLDVIADVLEDFRVHYVLNMFNGVQEGYERTLKPFVENAAHTRQAWVEIGETTVVEYINLADLAKAKEEARKRQSQPGPDAKETQPKP